MPQNQVQPTIFFIKCPVPSQVNGNCYIIVRFRVLYFGVVFLLCRSSLIFDTFPSVLVCNPDLFFLYRFINFEQRYTTVALI